MAVLFSFETFYLLRKSLHFLNYFQDAKITWQYVDLSAKCTGLKEFARFSKAHHLICHFGSVLKKRWTNIFSMGPRCSEEKLAVIEVKPFVQKKIVKGQFISSSLRRHLYKTRKYAKK